MSVPSLQIDKLDDRNYDSWEVQMRSVLIHGGYWKMVSGKLTHENAEDKLKFEADDEKALATILLCVKSPQLAHVKKCKSSRDAWVKLQEVHHPKGPLQKVSLYKRLLNLTMAQDGNVVQHINDFTEISEKLAETGIEIQEELLSIMLLSSLPKEFENFVVAIETRDSLPNFTILKQKVLEEGKRRNENNESEVATGEHAFTAKSVKKKKFGNNFKKERKEFKGNCFVCGEKGHYANQCEKKQNNKNKGLAMLSAAEVKSWKETAWYIDSGATSHMCNDRRMFTRLDKHDEQIALAGDNYIKAIGKGDIVIRRGIEMKDVLYSPELQANFISVSKAVEKGYTVIFDSSKATINDRSGEVLLQADRKDSLFVLRNSAEKAFAACNSDIAWHNRMGHLNFKSLRELSRRNIVRDMQVNSRGDTGNCRTCMLSKIHVLPFPDESNTKTKDLLQLVHSDVCGPFRTNSVGGSKYFVTFIDDLSRRIFVYFMKAKNEVFKYFKIFKAQVELQTGHKIKAIRSDNGREYVNAEFDAYLQTYGITRQLTVAYTPQQNGVAERANRTLVEMARSMMVHAGVIQCLWAEAINTAAYIRNRCTSNKLGDKTPYEVWWNKKPTVKHFRTFGSIAVALDKSHKKSKFEAKGRQYIMVGYSTTAKAYRLYDKKSHKVIEHRDVLFDETAFNKSFDGDNPEEGVDLVLLNWEKEIDTLQQSKHEDAYDTPNSDIDSDSSAHQMSEEQAEREVKIGQGRPKLPRTCKVSRPKDQFNELYSMVGEGVPQTIEEALTSKNSRKWKKAMEDEYFALKKNNTWSVTDLPADGTAIPCKWVFALKKDEHGKIVRYKARLVAKGCNQRYGIDYKEVFSPVARYSTIRLMLALAVQHEMHLHQIDVNSAYLNSELQDTIYMQQPQHFVEGESSQKVLKLHKAIYGLKQSGKEWNSKLDGVLTRIGFTACENEPCLYKANFNEQLTLVLVYVDDLIIGCRDKAVVIKIKLQLAELFEVSDKGMLQHFLGIEFSRDGETGEMTICQAQYIREMLSQYGMKNCKAVSVPLEKGYQVDCADDCEKANQTDYQSLIGALMYLAITTRPDILHSVSKMAQRNCNPHVEHFCKLKHILKYLAGTVEMRMKFRAGEQSIKGFVDADWGGDVLDRKSYTGFMFFYGDCPISWESRKQHTVALSSTEAEYMAASDATKEAIYMRRLLVELGIGQNEPVELYIDNQGAMKLAQNPVYHKRSKHIDIKFHHIREAVQRKEVELRYCPTDEMLADILTKNLARNKHYNFMKLMNFE